MTTDWTNITVALQFVAGIGGPWLIGQLVALLAENWPTWKNLPRQVKVIAPLVGSVIVSVGATILLRQQAVIEVIGPYWTLIATAVITYLGSQYAYMQAKASGDGVKTVGE